MHPIEGLQPSQFMGHGLASNLMHGGSPILSYDTEANVMSFNLADPQVMGGT